MTKNDLEEIEDRCNEASPGPWLHGNGVWFSDSMKHAINIDNVPNTEFIAHARQDIPDLIAEIRRLQAKEIELRDMLARMSRF